MAGHSQFKNIMHRKGAQDAKRAKVFAKHAREIEVAARAGLPDPAQNPRLRNAILAARGVNMPRDRIDRAIAKASGAGDDATRYEEVRYEGYGPGGTALIVMALTDNRNRTASEVRSAFSKYGGNLGETNSVAFLFNRVGQITYPARAGTSERVFEAALEAGAEDVTSDGDGHTIVCSPDDFASVAEALEKILGAPAEAALTWRPLTTVAVGEETAPTLMKLIDALEDSDDVQSVASNFEIDDAVMARLAG